MLAGLLWPHCLDIEHNVGVTIGLTARLALGFFWFRHLFFPGARTPAMG